MTLAHILRGAGFLLVFCWFMFGGVAHFTQTDFFAAIVPDFIPYPREIALITGVTDIAGALGILWPRTRRIAGYALILYCLCVLPVHTEMLRHAERYAAVGLPFLWGRLIFQPVLIWIIWVVTKPARASDLPAAPAPT
jgi:uncharacterized membrane protein